MIELMKALGYFFNNASFLEEALRHPSLGKANNQRLEFLGDAVLECCVSDIIFHSHQGMQEGQLTALRQQMVCEKALALVARSVGLGRYLKMEHGVDAMGGRRMDSVLSDAMEAVLAAVYLDGGYQAAFKCIRDMWQDEELFHFTDMDAKSSLQEYLQGNGHKPPEYTLVEESGPAHARVFRVSVLVDGRELAQGVDTTKKKAEQTAAKQALELIRTQAGE